MGHMRLVPRRARPNSPTPNTFVGEAAFIDAIESYRTLGIKEIAFEYGFRRKFSILFRANWDSDGGSDG
jgi:hypothetical protein